MSFFQNQPTTSSAPSVELGKQQQDSYNRDLLRELDPANASSVYAEARSTALALYLVNVMLAVFGAILFFFFAQQVFADQIAAASSPFSPPPFSASPY